LNQANTEEKVRRMPDAAAITAYTNTLIDPPFVMVMTTTPVLLGTITIVVTENRIVNVGGSNVSAYVPLSMDLYA
jgi:hypothetical protein